MLHAGTKLAAPEKQLYQKMMSKFTEYNKVGKFASQNYFGFCEDILRMDVRLGQHFLEVAFYKSQASLMDFQQYLPEIVIDAPPQTLFVNNSVIVAGIHARLLKTQTFFKDGKLIVLEAPRNLTNIDTSLAVQEAGQRCPDYRYLIHGRWRYYDLKSGKMHFNHGHVLSTAHAEHFENMASYLITEQLRYYRSNEEVYNFLSKVVADNTLSWTERNELVHGFYLDILPKYPEINPSLIFKHNLSYETKNLKVPKEIETIVQGHITVSREESEKALIDLISRGNRSSINQYFEAPYNNQNIVKALKDIMKNGLDDNNN